ncbi:T-complex protein 1 subunit beta-like [Dermacentor silvarum]|uniref:T-complex protein 1 subunit beta-like n=1 Tax=Dermacentor silvarum TaxID=543639 RepID=UPI0018976A06|nr:T-complex protein 1 subunit beta-like [Dermacentor silvarum]
MSQMGSLNAVRILKGEAEEEKAETARLSSFVGAIAIGDLMKSTLGPKGMDKILMCQGRQDKVEVTNDGATILKAVGVDNPAAKILVDISKVQDDEVGDGTTSVTVLAAELLKEAEHLVSMKIHPQTIIGGWRQATAVARQALESFAEDHSADEARFREDILNIARTTLGSKILAQHKEFFAQLAFDAVMRLKGSGNLDAIQILKRLGSNLTDSFLAEGAGARVA